MAAQIGIASRLTFSLVFILGIIVLWARFADLVARTYLCAQFSCAPRSFAGYEEPPAIPAIQSLKASFIAQPALLVLCHLSLAPLSVILRMGFKFNKYLVIATISGG
jgi:hypothetical protein